MKSRNLKAMLLGVAFAASLTFAGTQPQMQFMLQRIRMWNWTANMILKKHSRRHWM